MSSPFVFYRSDNRLITGDYLFTEFKKLYLGPQVILVIALFGFSCLGIVDSFYKANPDDSVIWMAVGAPAVLAIWSNITIQWETDLTRAKLFARNVFAAFVVAAPLLILNTSFLAVLWMTPWSRDLLMAGGTFDDHSTLGVRTMLVLVGGFASQMMGSMVPFILATGPRLYFVPTPSDPPIRR